MTITWLSHDYHITDLRGGCLGVFAPASWHTLCCEQCEEWHSTSEETHIQKPNIEEGRRKRGKEEREKEGGRDGMEKERRKERRKKGERERKEGERKKKRKGRKERRMEGGKERGRKERGKERVRG